MNCDRYTCKHPRLDHGKVYSSCTRCSCPAFVKKLEQGESSNPSVETVSLFGSAVAEIIDNFASSNDSPSDSSSSSGSSSSFDGGGGDGGGGGSTDSW